MNGLCSLISVKMNTTYQSAVVYLPNSLSHNFSLIFPSFQLAKQMENNWYCDRSTIYKKNHLVIDYSWYSAGNKRRNLKNEFVQFRVQLQPDLRPLQRVVQQDQPGKHDRRHRRYRRATAGTNNDQPTFHST